MQHSTIKSEQVDYKMRSLLNTLYTLDDCKLGNLNLTYNQVNVVFSADGCNQHRVKITYSGDVCIFTHTVDNFNVDDPRIPNIPVERKIYNKSDMLSYNVINKVLSIGKVKEMFIAQKPDNIVWTKFTIIDY